VKKRGKLACDVEGQKNVFEMNYILTGEIYFPIKIILSFNFLKLVSL